MSFDLHIPEDSQRGQAISMLVAKQKMTPEAVLERIVDEGLVATSWNRRLDESTVPKRSYASFFGAVKGGYGSPEAVDQAIEEMRNERRKNG